MFVVYVRYLSIYQVCCFGCMYPIFDFLVPEFVGCVLQCTGDLEIWWLLWWCCLYYRWFFPCCRSDVIVVDYDVRYVEVLGIVLCFLDVCFVIVIGDDSVFVVFCIIWFVVLAPLFDTFVRCCLFVDMSSIGGVVFLLFC